MRTQLSQAAGLGRAVGRRPHTRTSKDSQGHQDSLGPSPETPPPAQGRGSYNPSTGKLRGSSRARTAFIIVFLCFLPLSPVQPFCLSFRLCRQRIPDKLLPCWPPPVPSWSPVGLALPSPTISRWAQAGPLRQEMAPYSPHGTSSHPHEMILCARLAACCWQISVCQQDMPTPK